MLHVPQQCQGSNQNRWISMLSILMTESTWAGIIYLIQSVNSARLWRIDTVLWFIYSVPCMLPWNETILDVTRYCTYRARCVSRTKSVGQIKAVGITATFIMTLGNDFHSSRILRQWISFVNRDLNQERRFFLTRAWYVWVGDAMKSAPLTYIDFQNKQSSAFNHNRHIFSWRYYFTTQVDITGQKRISTSDE